MTSQIQDVKIINESSNKNGGKLKNNKNYQLNQLMSSFQTCKSSIKSIIFNDLEFFGHPVYPRS